jgi:hypothetical protein
MSPFRGDGWRVSCPCDIKRVSRSHNTRLKYRDSEHRRPYAERSKSPSDGSNGARQWILSTLIHVPVQAKSYTGRRG